MVPAMFLGSALGGGGDGCRDLLEIRRPHLHHPTVGAVSAFGGWDLRTLPSWGRTNCARDGRYGRGNGSSEEVGQLMGNFASSNGQRAGVVCTICIGTRQGS